MTCYVANKHGDHEVHKETCSTLPDLDNQVPLGSHDSCHTAVAKAKEIFGSADGCKNCCPDCHNY